MRKRKRLRPQLWHEKFTVAQRMIAIGIVVFIALVGTGFIHEVTLHSLEVVDGRKNKLSETMEKAAVLSEHSKWQFAEAILLMEANENLNNQYSMSVRESGVLFSGLASTSPPDLRASVAKVRKAQAELNKLIINYSESKEMLGLSPKSGLQGKLRSSVHDIESAILQSGGSKKMISMLLMRRHEKDFMLRGSEKYLTKHDKEVAHFAQLISESPISVSKKLYIKSLLNKYQSDLKAYADLHIKLRHEKKEFESKFTDKVSPGFKNLTDRVDVERNKLITESEAIYSSASLYLWAGVSVLMMLVMALLYFIANSVTSPLRLIGNAMDALDDGDTSVDLDIRLPGSIGQLTDAYEKLKETSKEAFQLQRTVEMSPQAIMIADAETLVINYLNPAARVLFESIEEGLPCKAHEINGKCIDIFHKNPKHQRQLLSKEENLPAKAHFKISGRSIEFEAFAIEDNNGAFQSLMVSWSDVTERVKLADDFETRVGVAVKEIMSFGKEVQDAALILSAMAQQSSSQSESVSQSARQASDNVISVAAATEELTATTSEIDRQAHQVVNLSGKAVDESARAIEDVKRLSEGADQIGRIVDLITGIASNTTLLSLNAGIEAANAGEAGKGFAVVANEVKNLAARTTREAESISKQITSMQRDSKKMSLSISGVSKIVGDMSESNQSIATATEQQHSATKEISVSIQSANVATNKASHEVSGVIEAATKTGDAAADLLVLSEQLSKKGEYLSERVAEFLEGLRA